jgi:hypothetical protein
MPGNFSPCGEVTFGEVVDAIIKWINGVIPLRDIIDLIYSWAEPANYPPN